MRCRLWFILALALSIIVALTVAEEAEVATDGEVQPATPKPKAPPKKRSTKEWSKTNFDAVEKTWEEGDDPELLEHEFEITRRIAEKKRAETGQGISLNPIKDPVTGEERLDPEQMQKLMSMTKNDPMGLGMGGTGGVMVFVELHPERSKGTGWTKREVDKLSGRWVGLLRSASLDGKVYNTQQDDPNPKKPTLLISVDKQWMAQDVMKFVLQQRETAKVRGARVPAAVCRHLASPVHRLPLLCVARSRTTPRSTPRQTSPPRTSPKRTTTEPAPPRAVFPPVRRRFCAHPPCARRAAPPTPSLSYTYHYTINFFVNG
jgi:hypothetical protein